MLTLSKIWRKKVKTKFIFHLRNFIVPIIVVALLVVGGYGSKPTKSVEAITTDETPLCTLPDLPDIRYRYTMENHILCGESPKNSSCLYYVAGKWKK